MVRMRGLALRIGTIMFGTLTGILVLVSLVSIKFKNFALGISQGFIGATLEIWSACLSYFGEYIERFVKVGVTIKSERTRQHTKRLING